MSRGCVRSLEAHHSAERSDLAFQSDSSLLPSRLSERSADRAVGADLRSYRARAQLREIPRRHAQPCGRIVDRAGTRGDALECSCYFVCSWLGLMRTRLAGCLATAACLRGRSCSAADSTISTSRLFKRQADEPGNQRPAVGNYWCRSSGVTVLVGLAD
jgi:hypothetical protein